MEIGGQVISAETLNRISVCLVYFPISLISFRFLFPRLSPPFKRMAGIVLIAQVLVVVLSLEIQPNSLYEEWLWSIDAEWNIPSTLASTQLALVAAVALFISWLARARPAWERLCFLEFGLILLFLAADEFFDIYKLLFAERSLGYAVLGLLILLTTLAMALRSPRHLLLLPLTWLAGLSLIAFGGIVLDNRPLICGTLGLFRNARECLDIYYLEESLELAGGWLILLAMLGWFAQISPPKLFFRRALYIIPLLWILLLSRVSPVPHGPTYKIRSHITAASVQFESGEYLYGFSIAQAGNQVQIQIFSYPWQALDEEIVYSIHLMDQVSGESFASRDRTLRRNHVFPLFGGTFMKVYANDLAFDASNDIPVNHAFSILLSLWREQDGEFVRQNVIASDHQLLSDSQVILRELVLPAAAHPPASAPLAMFDIGFALQAVDFPSTASPGETMPITFSWRSNTDGGENHVQFLHLGHVESGEWFVYDQQPFGPRLPTRLWYSGLADSETWHVSLPDNLAPGEYQVFTGLYRTGDGERLLVTDADGAPWLDNRILIGNLTLDG